MNSKQEPFLSSLSKSVRRAMYYFMGVIALSFVGGFWSHYEHYGYWFNRPDILKAANTIIKVEQLFLVQTSNCSKPQGCSFVVDPDILLSEILSESYDDLYKRLPSYLQSKGRLPTSFDKDLTGVVDLYTPMIKSPIIATPEDGFTNHIMSGIILIGETSSGEKRAFISAIGTQIADEYVPYYEAIFKVDTKNQSVQYLEGQRFFFDTDINELMLTFASIIILILILGAIPMVIVIIIDDILSHRRGTP